MDSTVLGFEFDSTPDSSKFFVGDQVPPSFLQAKCRYSILEEIGRGGAGVVYRARDLTLNREVAAKVLHGELVDLQTVAARFTNEALVMGSLQHPGIAHVYECGFTECGRPFHTMKLVLGDTLAVHLKKLASDPNYLGRVIDIFAKVCHAMAYTHSQCILHLDLKPANIMVGAFGEVHIMDWGLARFAGDRTSTEREFIDPDGGDESSGGESADGQTGNAVHGTLSYMAPEQACGGIVDRRTDVFCLGGILCEILTGSPPYEGKSLLACLDNARKANLGPAFDALDRCEGNRALVRLAKKCLQLNPADRPLDASSLSNEITRQSVSTLERAAEDLTNFFELSLDLFCIAGFDGYFRRINKNFSRLLGYTDEELLARPFLDFVVAEDQQETNDVMGQLFNGKPVVRFRNRYRDINGRLIWLEWTAKSTVDESLIYAVARSVGE
ncbi:MAG: protein kinase [Mariniblastus sp.]|nr:protein kinase [Mariniblastus sp.]